jgi:hypothetical protein
VGGWRTQGITYSKYPAITSRQYRHRDFHQLVMISMCMSHISLARVMISKTPRNSTEGVKRPYKLKAGIRSPGYHLSPKKNCPNKAHIFKNVMASVK